MNIRRRVDNRWSFGRFGLPRNRVIRLPRTPEELSQRAVEQLAAQASVECQMFGPFQTSDDHHAPLFQHHVLPRFETLDFPSLTVEDFAERKPPFAIGRKKNLFDREA